MVKNRNKSLSVFNFVLALFILVVVSCYLFIDFSLFIEESNFFDNEIIESLLFIAYPFIIIALINAFLNLISKKPILEINDEHFYDNTHFSSIGSIRHKDIIGYYIKGNRVNFVITKEDTYLNKINFLKRTVAVLKYRLGLEYVAFSLRVVKNEKEEFLNILKERYILLNSKQVEKFRRRR